MFAVGYSGDDHDTRLVQIRTGQWVSKILSSNFSSVIKNLSLIFSQKHTAERPKLLILIFYIGKNTLHYNLFLLRKYKIGAEHWNFACLEYQIRVEVVKYLNLPFFPSSIKG